jgi:hypothetical protein
MAILPMSDDEVQMTAEHETGSDDLLQALREAGATKLAWTVEHSEDQGSHDQWTFTMQAANEMGAPVPLSTEIEQLLREAVRSGALGTRQTGSWVMDVHTGSISRPQPRSGEGAGAPGIIGRGI